MDLTQEIFDKTMDWEGGYQNWAKDSGNYDSLKRLIGTNMGISAPTLETYLKKYKNIDLTKKSQSEAIALSKALTKDEVKFIMNTMYWKAAKCDKIKSYPLAWLLFDWYWGSGGYSCYYAKAAINISENKAGRKEPFSLKLYSKQWTDWDINWLNEYKNQVKLFEIVMDAKVAHYKSLKYEQPTINALVKRALFLNEKKKLITNAKRGLGLFGIIAISGLVVFAYKKLKNNRKTLKKNDNNNR